MMPVAVTGIDDKLCVFDRGAPSLLSALQVQGPLVDGKVVFAICCSTPNSKVGVVLFVVTCTPT